MKLFLLLSILFSVLFSELGFSQLSVRPARTISFTTTEGTEMNVSVSPDGRTLLFDILGNIYTLPVAGGKAQQLTRGMSVNFRPVWAPNGKSFACHTDETGEFRVKIFSFNGNNLDIKSDYPSRPQDNIIWTADSKSVICNEKIYTLSNAGIVECGPVIGFDKNAFVYYIKENTSKKSYITRAGRIQDTAEQILQTIKADIANRKSFKISPDGKLISFIAVTNGLYKLCIKNLATGIERYLLTLSGKQMDYSFSLDSKSIYIASFGKIHRVNVLSGKNKIIPFNALINIQLGALNYHQARVPQGTSPSRYIRTVNRNFDRSKMVFTSQGSIYIANGDGSKPCLFAEQAMNQFQPVFSPDGKKVAYVTWSDTAGGALWYKELQASAPVKVSSAPGVYSHPAWAPDNKTIAVVHGATVLGDRDDLGTGNLESFNIQQGSVRTIVTSIPLQNSLAFSGDGQNIMYRRYQNDSTEAIFVSCDLNGGNKTILAKGDCNQNEFQVFISPDQRFIVCSIFQDLYLFPIRNRKIVPWLYKGCLFSRTSYGIKLGIGVDPVWEKGGKILGWTYANTFYQVNPDSVLAEAQRITQNKKDSADLCEMLTDLQYIPLKTTEIVLNKEVKTGEGALALTNVRIITMQENKMIERGTVLIRNGRIVEVAAAKNINIPEDYQVMDLKGKTIIPGLIDLHLHMRIPSDILPQQSWMFLINLAYGITTCRDPSLNFESFGCMEMLETGRMTGPRLITVGRAARGGVIASANLNDTRSYVEKRKLLGGTEIKQYEFGGRARKQSLLTACFEEGLNMTNEGSGDFFLMLQMIKDGSTGIEHNLNWAGVTRANPGIAKKTEVYYYRGVAVYNDLIQFISKSGTYLTPTLQVGYAPAAKEYFKYKYWSAPDAKLSRFTIDDGEVTLKDNGAESLTTIRDRNTKDTLPLFLEAAKIDAAIYNAGGKITLGSHGNNEGIGAHNEIWALQMGGLTNHQALEIATIRGAEALGLQQDIGSIAKGKIADLVILNSNPLEDIHNTRDIKYVMKDGILYDGDTLDTVWPYHKTCPEWKFKLGGQP